jgi:hypothetical protein
MCGTYAMMAMSKDACRLNILLGKRLTNEEACHIEMFSSHSCLSCMVRARKHVILHYLRLIYRGILPIDSERLTSACFIIFYVFQNLYALLLITEIGLNAASI